MNLPWIFREFANGELSFLYLFYLSFLYLYWMKMKLKVLSFSYVMIELSKFNPYKFIFDIPINHCQSLTGYMQNSTFRQFDNFPISPFFYFNLIFRFLCFFLSKSVAIRKKWFGEEVYIKLDNELDMLILYKINL